MALRPFGRGRLAPLGSRGHHEGLVAAAPCCANGGRRRVLRRALFFLLVATACVAAVAALRGLTGAPRGSAGCRTSLFGLEARCDEPEIVTPQWRRSVALLTGGPSRVAPELSSQEFWKHIAKPLLADNSFVGVFTSTKVADLQRWLAWRTMMLDRMRLDASGGEWAGKLIHQINATAFPDVLPLARPGCNFAYDAKGGGVSISQQYFHIRRAHDAVLDYERRNNFRFDFFMRTRNEWFYFQPFNPQWLDRLEPNQIAHPAFEYQSPSKSWVYGWGPAEGRMHTLVAEQILISRRDPMEHFVRMFDSWFDECPYNATDLHASDGIVFIEHFVAIHLYRGNFQACAFPFAFDKIGDPHHLGVLPFDCAQARNYGACCWHPDGEGDGVVDFAGSVQSTGFSSSRFSALDVPFDEESLRQ
ncbi:unnamed protein product [Pedinophyceae sp. YPF-701]|nr:unnamed protein product [Pedinophyceae sp. YPF-701]